MNNRPTTRLSLAFAATALFCGVAATQGSPPKSVSSGAHNVQVTRPEKTLTIMGNVAPRTPGAVFLMFSLVTDDPCFDPNKNGACFGSGLSPMDKATVACGQVETADGKVYPADGGGLIEGKLMCGFVVPAETSGTVKLRLKGYPDLGLEVAGSSSGASSPASGGTSPAPGSSPKQAQEMERLISWLAGDWETVEWYEKEPGTRQEIGKGVATFTKGPGGLSLLCQYHAQRSGGKTFNALDLLYWNPEKSLYVDVYCDGSGGCSLGKTGNWEGADLVIRSEYESPYGHVEDRAVYTDVKPESFTYYVEKSLAREGVLRGRVGVNYRKVSSPRTHPPNAP